MLQNYNTEQAMSIVKRKKEEKNTKESVRIANTETSGLWIVTKFVQDFNRFEKRVTKFLPACNIKVVTNNGDLTVD